MEIDDILDKLRGSDYFQTDCKLTKRQSVTLLEHIEGLQFLLNEIPELTAYTITADTRIAELEAENAALKEYRDGHDPKVEFPPEGVWVNMRDRYGQAFTLQYDSSMIWFADDPDLVRWYPIPPLPELPEVKE